ncbi:MAG: phenylphosphate carboxylase subunit delta [Phycisphaerae bacterium]|nr:phenylphosphate carboxylase subunit delta [Phycisphaerae bacterium]
MNPSHPKDIALLVLDVDGVLTDGSIIVDPDGRELKRFNVRDGLGIKAWQRMGFAAAILSARTSPTVEHRARELALEHVVQGAMNKGEGLDRLLAATGLDASRVAYVGDDWLDVPVLRRVGYPVVVGDADAYTREFARYVTRAPGGRGAVRETVEHLLRAKNLLARAQELLASGAPPAHAPGTAAH